MYKTLRIICCIISALTLAACVFIFIYLGFIWGIVSLFVAAAFFGLMLLFKNLQEQQEQKLNPSAPKGDFITGPVAKSENTTTTDTTSDKKSNK
jgi:hypothetical protein